MRAITGREPIRSAVAAETASALPSFSSRKAVKIAALHSQTGTIALTQASLVDAEKLAIDEIDAGGGAPGRTIEAVVAVGAGDGPTSLRKGANCLSTTRSSRRSTVIPGLRARQQ